MLPFIKMHGLGNDYVYVDGFTHEIADPSELARKIADRHFGVGGDGLILVLPPRPSGGNAHCRMRMFNADGSEGQMCGNGIRCVAKFFHDHALTPDAQRHNPLRVDTDNGTLVLSLNLDDAGLVHTVRVDMGAPRLDLADIPIDPAHTTPTDHDYVSKIEVEGFGDYDATFVNTGNPHAVIFTEDAEQFADFREHLHTLGPKLEHHPAFPDRANVHFVRVRNRSNADVLHWERGSGATLACGTGASAVCVAGFLTGRSDRALTAHLPGGPLDLRWDQTTRHVFMTGPATEVFVGEWPD